ncbi:porphobilinogen deaminase [Methanobrevibacter arboriphilus JCM 13429 = DSM 1125]|uniref:Probable porphobilinogen deaminase n=1 Tax=Methanobrevibacter arboriphilus JCM 13429 = DSM 1125 TaxID=1300164 RepID=A0A1V6N1G0_METAZ|nr:hydroxymethylbilane synthase [Methanobrevibacter arboriphilus]OQD58474.1 porphobilinogen deaminase [Methanobrevibacter arboriphilus JCM 13429 = DSM 1125]
MIVGTRGSELALTQTNYIRNRLFDLTNNEVETKIIKTTGDKITTSQLYNMDSKGLFTKELDRAVLEEEVDFAVHSLKDVPTELNEDLEIAAVPIRESPNEVLVSNYSWEDLKKGSTLGTSSLRREAFCNMYEKGLELKPIRGNIGTRVEKVLDGEVDATIMAEAGLNRLGLTKCIKNRFSLDYLTPPAGQGALAIITRKDSLAKNTIRKLNHHESEQEVLAEKTVLKELGIGCQWPLGSIARVNGNELSLYSILLTQKGEILHKAKLKSPIGEAEDLGKKLANDMKEFI